MGIFRFFGFGFPFGIGTGRGRGGDVTGRFRSGTSRTEDGERCRTETFDDVTILDRGRWDRGNRDMGVIALGSGGRHRGSILLHGRKSSGKRRIRQRDKNRRITHSRQIGFEIPKRRRGGPLSLCRGRIEDIKERTWGIKSEGGFTIT